MSRLVARLLIFPLALTVTAVSAQEGAIESLRQTGKAFASVARSVSPAVVFIQVESRLSAAGSAQLPSPFDDEFFRHFFGDEFPSVPRRDAPGGERRVMGQGSGFAFAPESRHTSDKTYLLTNHHVVANADEIRVKFQDGREFGARIKGADPKSDVAVLEIDATGLPSLPLADSSRLEVGEWVVAIGNPFGLSHTLTVGVVSAKGRTSLGINDYEDFIQTDAAINPGNSGGPLVNLDGEVVGMNTAIFSRSGGYMGVGFAIPINLAKAIADQLVEEGEVTRGYLGIVIQPLTPDLAKSFGLTDTRGILIASVSEGSPAAAAGLRQGDVIVAYRGEPVSDIGGFRNRVAFTRPGAREALTIIRDGGRQEVTVTIGRQTGEERTAQGSAQATETLGLTVRTLTSELAEQFGAEAGQGVVVTQVTPGSIAAQAGIGPGAVIVQVNRKPVSTAVQFKQAVEESRSDRRVLLLIRSGEMQQYLVLSW
ncbi:MAG: DegQ family serine endoprotease [Gammaproteobacteria bacterium]